jgi:hypothetical protein
MAAVRQNTILEVNDEWKAVVEEKTWNWDLKTMNWSLKIINWGLRITN